MFSRVVGPGKEQLVGNPLLPLKKCLRKGEEAFKSTARSRALNQTQPSSGERRWRGRCEVRQARERSPAPGDGTTSKETEEGVHLQ